MNDTNKQKTSAVIVSIAIFVILCSEIVYSESKQPPHIDEIRNKIVPSHEVWSEYNKLKEISLTAVQRANTTRRPNQPQLPSHIDEIRKKTVPAYEVWLRYETLKDEMSPDYRAKQRQKMEVEATEIQYSQLLQMKEKASTEEQYQELTDKFQAMNGYKNTLELAIECRTQYRKLKEQREKLEWTKRMDEDAAKALRKEIVGTWKSVIMGSGTYTFSLNEWTWRYEGQPSISEISYDGERWYFESGVLSNRKKFFLRKVDVNTFEGTVTFSDGKSFPARFERQK